MRNLQELEKELSSFDPQERTSALKDIIEKNSGLNFPVSELINLHFHSFYSYNSDGWSPTRIAWEAKKNGLLAVGIVDFDVLDGMQDFFDACAKLELRASVGVETRSFFAKFAELEINSPGEPGVNYVMGVGFTEKFHAGSSQALKLAQYRENARQRNLSLISRINEKVHEIAVDYERDVLPLTPSGNATERHIITAYVESSFKSFKDEDKTFVYMASVLNKKASELGDIFKKSRPAFDELVRAKFAKKGGLGYVQTSQDSFPPMREFFAWVKSAGAIPTEAWLDGTTAAESLGVEYLEATRAEGAEALNIIPDRNWNIKDVETKKMKIAKLAEIINAAEKLYMPIIIGTEMNKSGQPFADDINGEELFPFKKIFIKGAKIAVGHTLLAKFAKFPYSGENANSEFNTVEKKNIFFESLGGLSPFTKSQIEKLTTMKSDDVFAKFADSAKAGQWKF